MLKAPRLSDALLEGPKIHLNIKPIILAVARARHFKTNAFIHP
jgi:hypothetical protein